MSVPRSPLPSDQHVAVPPAAAEAVPSAQVRALRTVHRAVAELRRGTPVLLLGPGGGDGLLIAAAETVSGRSLALLGGALPLPAEGLVLLLAAARAAALRPNTRGAGDATRSAIPPSATLPPAPQPPAPLPATDAEAPVQAFALPPAAVQESVLRRLADPVRGGEALAGTNKGSGAVPASAPQDPSPDALLSAATSFAATSLPADALPCALPAGAEAAIALAKLGRLLPALVARPLVLPVTADASEALAAELDLLAVPAADILAYPQGVAATLARVAEARVPLEDAAEARIVAFRAADGGIEHLAILVGEPEALVAKGEAPLARVHSECFTGDLLGSLRCDCGPQLRGAIKRMAEEGAGVLLYLAQEGRGIGLVNKLRAYTLQDAGLDTLDANRALGYGADERRYLVAATMLRELGIPSVRLLTNNPDKMAALAACGVNVTERAPHRFAANGVNDAYLETKAKRFGHLLG